MLQIKHLTATQKNFQPCKLAVAGGNTQRPPARTENYCESKQTYFNYSLDRSFDLPEFQVKLFFTRNWLGGFYWDNLLDHALINIILSLSPQMVSAKSKRGLIKALYNTTRASKGNRCLIRFKKPILWFTFAINDSICSFQVRFLWMTTSKYLIESFQTH